jgi:hypothetical protein
MTTKVENIQILDFLANDFYAVQYYAYDKIKKKNCILILTKVPTSWEYSIEYL